MDELVSAVLGETEGTIAMETASDNRRMVSTLVSQTRRSLYIFSQEIDDDVYDNDEFIDALSSLARRSRYSDVRILVQDSTRAFKRGHRLIRLAQKLSSLIHVKNPSIVHERVYSEYLLADGVGYLYRSKGDIYHYDAHGSFRDPRFTNELEEQFKDMWEQASPDRSFRQLHI